MELTRVTMTGADDGIAWHDLFTISKKYPFVEWAILLSRSSSGFNRFPSRSWLDQLVNEDRNNLDSVPDFAGHLCGSYVREFLSGDASFVSEIGEAWKMFTRIQINTHGIFHIFNRSGLLALLHKFEGKEFIFQYDETNKYILDFLMKEGVKNISTLFDLSHGAGIVPDTWPKSINGINCGYAGGLSPENVVEQIHRMNDVIEPGAKVWIDMETKVRSNNDKLFDLEKVKSVLKLCEPYTSTALA